MAAIVIQLPVVFQNETQDDCAHGGPLYLLKHSNVKSPCQTCYPRWWVQVQCVKVK